MSLNCMTHEKEKLKPERLITLLIHLIQTSILLGYDLHPHRICSQLVISPWVQLLNYKKRKNILQGHSTWLNC